jgi:hypothetical protein
MIITGLSHSFDMFKLGHHNFILHNMKSFVPVTALLPIYSRIMIHNIPKSLFLEI